MVRAFLAVLVVVFGYLVFEFGRIQANYNIVDAAAERQGYEDRIEGMSRTSFGTTSDHDRENRYQWALWPALLLGILNVCSSDRRR